MEEGAEAEVVRRGRFHDPFDGGFVQGAGGSARGIGDQVARDAPGDRLRPPGQMLPA